MVEFNSIYAVMYLAMKGYTDVKSPVSGFLQVSAESDSIVILSFQKWQLIFLITSSK